MALEPAPPLPDAFHVRIADWPDAASQRFRQIREVVLQAATDMEIGAIDESLKWGEPAWRPRKPRQGSTLRCSWSGRLPDQIGLFVDCKTTLGETMRTLYPAEFRHENNRALRLDLTATLPRDAIDHLARLVFAYHRRPRGGS